MALALATGQTWLRVPEAVRVQVHGRFRWPVSAKDLSLHRQARVLAGGVTGLEREGVWITNDAKRRETHERERDRRGRAKGGVSFGLSCRFALFVIQSFRAIRAPDT